MLRHTPFTTLLSRSWAQCESLPSRVRLASTMIPPSRRLLARLNNIDEQSEDRQRGIDDSDPNALPLRSRRRQRPKEPSLPPREPNFIRTHVPRKLTRPGNGENSSFTDLKVIKLTPGSGGDGGIHFMRSITLPLGPPGGGNGGRGGDIYIVGSKELTSFNSLLQRYRAGNGGKVDPNRRHGANGADIEVVVPIGTIVRQVDAQEEIARRSRIERGEEEDVEGSERDLSGRDRGDVTDPRSPLAMERVNKHFYFPDEYTPQADRVAYLLDRIPPRTSQPGDSKPLYIDVTREGERFLLARGGSGGLGNPHYAPPQNRLLRGFAVAGRGEPGEAVWIEVELRTLADAGLVGLPNAGKSTLLRAISGAKPRVSDHPFTTLRPHVGTVEHDGDKGWSAHVADVPGLVEGAHLDVGLGHSFLRHIERCKVLLYVVDLAGLDPARDLRVLREELEKHQEGLSKRKCIVVANKADLSELARSNLEALVAEAGPDVPVIPVSAKERKNVEMVVLHLRKLLADLSN